MLRAGGHGRRFRWVPRCPLPHPHASLPRPPGPSGCSLERGVESHVSAGGDCLRGFEGFHLDRDSAHASAQHSLRGLLQYSVTILGIRQAHAQGGDYVCAMKSPHVYIFDGFDACQGLDRGHCVLHARRRVAGNHAEQRARRGLQKRDHREADEDGDEE